MRKESRSQAREAGSAEQAPATRSLPEWIGATPDAKIPPRVRVRVFEKFGGKCYLSGRKIRPGDAWECEHITAIINGGEHRENNLAPALKDAHRAKTALDLKIKSKVARMKAKHLGTFPKSKAKIRSRGFAKSRPVVGEEL